MITNACFTYKTIRKKYYYPLMHYMRMSVISISDETDLKTELKIQCTHARILMQNGGIYERMDGKMD